MTKPLIPVADQAALVNNLASQHLGGSVVVNDDLSNLADFGKAYDNLSQGTKQIVTSGLITLVTEQLFIVKEYTGNGVDIIRSRSSYDQSEGLIQKNRPALPQAVSDAEVYDPAAGSTSDPFKNYPINFETEYFSKPFAFRYQWSKPERWMTGMFLTREGLGNAISAIDRNIRNAIELNIEDITMSTLRASMVLNLSTVADLTTKGNNHAVNLLSEYNSLRSTTLTKAKALGDPEFMRYAIHRIFVVMDYMKSYTRLYNEKEFPNFSTAEDMNLVLLSQFRRAVDQFLLSDTYHDEFLALPNGKSVAAWKGFLLAANSEPSFESTSTINDTIAVDWEQNPLTVNTDGVLAHIYDTERLGIYNLAILNTNQSDPVGLKTNYFSHVFGRTIADPYENAVTFYVK